MTTQNVFAGMQNASWFTPNATHVPGRLPAQDPLRTANTTETNVRMLWSAVQLWMQEFPYHPATDEISVWTNSVSSITCLVLVRASLHPISMAATPPQHFCLTCSPKTRRSRMVLSQSMRQRRSFRRIWDLQMPASIWLSKVKGLLTMLITTPMDFRCSPKQNTRLLPRHSQGQVVAKS